MLRIAVALFLVAGCGLLPGGISRDSAIEIASGHHGMRDAVVVDVVVKEASAIVWHGLPPPKGRMWIVRFRGITSMCPPVNGPIRCFDQVAETSVYLTYETGELLSSGTTPIP